MLLVSMLVLVEKDAVLMCGEVVLPLLEAPPLNRRFTSSSSVPVQHQLAIRQTDLSQLKLPLHIHCTDIQSLCVLTAGGGWGALKPGSDLTLWEKQINLKCHGNSDCCWVTRTVLSWVTKWYKFLSISRVKVPLLWSLSLVEELEIETDLPNVIIMGKCLKN